MNKRICPYSGEEFIPKRKNQIFANKKNRTDYHNDKARQERIILSTIDIKVRWNTLCDDNRSFWRVLINGEERIASNVILEIPTYTTKDRVWDTKRQDWVEKHHISCVAKEVIWKGDIVIIK